MSSVLGGGNRFFLLCSHQKNPFYSSKPESTELHQRQHSERGLRLFFGFSQRLALFPANKAGPRCKSVKDFVVSHLAAVLNYTSLSGWPRASILSLRHISLNNSSEIKRSEK